MKVKLVTFAPHPNFGTCLQSYALNYVLRKMGHDVEFIYNRRETPSPTFRHYVFAALKRIVKIFLSEKQICRLKERKNAMARNSQGGNDAPVIRGITATCRSARSISSLLRTGTSTYADFSPMLTIRKLLPMLTCSSRAATRFGIPIAAASTR